MSLSLKVSAALSPELLSPSRSSVKSGLANWAGSVPGWGSATQRSVAVAANSAAGRGGAGVWDACEAGDDCEAVAGVAAASPGGGGPGRARSESGMRLSRLSLACCRRSATCAAITRCRSMIRMHFSQVQSLKRQ